jgi:hypothetical protein
MEKRSDIHRPSAIDPEAYRYWGWDVLWPASGDGLGEIMMIAENRKMNAERLRAEGLRYSGHRHGGSCHVCGANARYVVIYLHEASRELIRVGEECAERMEMGREGFAALKMARKRVGDWRKAKAGYRKAAGILEAAGFPERVWEWYDGRFELDVWHGRPEEPRESEIDWDGMPSPSRRFGSMAEFEAAYDDYKRDLAAWRREKGISLRDEAKIREDEGILSDMIGKLIKYGSWSERAESFALLLWDRLLKAEERAKERAEKRAEERAVAADAPSGRVAIEGRVLKVESRESVYGIVDKMLIKDESGWMGWVSRPSGADFERGDKVRLVASWEVSRDDPKFAFGKRPSKAELVEAAPGKGVAAP